MEIKGEDKNNTKQLKQGSKKIFLSSTFVNFLANMSYTHALSPKEVHTIFNMWGPKMSNNKSDMIWAMKKQSDSNFDVKFVIVGSG